MIVNYLYLLTHTDKQVKELFLFSGLKDDVQTHNFLKSSTIKNQDDAYSVYKIRKKDTGWENLPHHIIDYIKNNIFTVDTLRKLSFNDDLECLGNFKPVFAGY